MTDDAIVEELNGRLVDLGLTPDMVPESAQAVVAAIVPLLNALIPPIADNATSLRIMAAALNTYAMATEDRARELEADQRRQEASR